MRRLITILFLTITINVYAQEAEKMAVGEDDGLTIINMSAVSYTTWEMGKGYNDIIDSLTYNGKYEEAIHFLKNQIKVDSTNPDLYCHLGDLKSMLYVNDTSCLNDYREAIKLDPNNLWAHYNSGTKYLSLTDDSDDYMSNIKKDSSIYHYDEVYIDKAIYHFDRVIQIDSTEFFNLKNTLIDLYTAKGIIWKVYEIKNCNYTIPANTDSVNVPQNPKAYYFPLGYLIDTVNNPFNAERDPGFLDRSFDLAHFVNRWYSQHLFTMQEPLLYNGFFQNEIYRFTWLRTFHEPIVIRIEKTENEIQLIAKRTDGAGGYGPGQLVETIQTKLIDKEWDKFKGLIADIDFWNLSPIEITNILGCDGAQWILEGSKDGEYHMIDRWSGDDKETGKACLYLLELSGLKIKRGDIY